MYFCSKFQFLFFAIYTFSFTIYAFEQFISYKCFKFDDDDIRFGVSYQQCVQRCENTDICKCVSYNQIMSACRMHITDGIPSDCRGYIHTKKSNWKGTLEKCSCRRHETKKKCSKPPARDNGILLGNDFSEDHNVKVVCFKGYVTNGTMSLKCMDGQWMGDVNCVLDPQCNKYLISGENGVSDSQLSELSNWCKKTNSSDCEGNFQLTSAKYARLNNKGFLTGGWYAGFLDKIDYLQVDFLQPRAIDSVVLQGRDYYQQWVTKFKIHLGDDCQSFSTVQDDSGNEKIFEGTNGSNVIVIRPLPKRQTARCLRLQPTEWHGYASLRFDVLGC